MLVVESTYEKCKRLLLAGTRDRRSAIPKEAQWVPYAQRTKPHRVYRVRITNQEAEAQLRNWKRSKRGRQFRARQKKRGGAIYPTTKEARKALGDEIQAFHERRKEAQRERRAAQ